MTLQVQLAVGATYSEKRGLVPAKLRHVTSNGESIARPDPTAASHQSYFTVQFLGILSGPWFGVLRVRSLGTTATVPTPGLRVGFLCLSVAPHTYMNEGPGGRHFVSKQSFYNILIPPSVFLYICLPCPASSQLAVRPPEKTKNKKLFQQERMACTSARPVPLDARITSPHQHQNYRGVSLARTMYSAVELAKTGKTYHRANSGKVTRRHHGSREPNRLQGIPRRTGLMPMGAVYHSSTVVKTGSLAYGRFLGAHRENTGKKFRTYSEVRTYTYQHTYV